ncbi:hypothetical protein LY632_03050 [Erythrobacter sp. SDW2]|uniref:hypothetical protein n=1 Tax=Erythrobacter sp. SDW2 TaxID=2907154 RepID=UPI001F3DDE4B|nr:hypothetical protein [Erythrobacter sp. SDW2]UIP07392.1 hypothetical protein LY632_03050 [Erythrobacter sp. SDW2]
MTGIALATSKSASGKTPGQARRWPTVLFVLLVLAAGVFLWFRTPITGYAQTASAYSARVACSCRFVAGRTMEDCAKDKLAGMELVSLTENEEEKSVTARFLLVASDTARMRDGYGCVLDKWNR